LGFSNLTTEQPNARRRQDEKEQVGRFTPCPLPYRSGKIRSRRNRGAVKRVHRHTGARATDPIQETKSAAHAHFPYSNFSSFPLVTVAQFDGQRGHVHQPMDRGQNIMGAQALKIEDNGAFEKEK
jgi:hypothetical protein